MAIQVILTVVQLISAAIGVGCGIRYRKVHRCAVCHRHPFTLFRYEWPDGRWERRCDQHLL